MMNRASSTLHPPNHDGAVAVLHGTVPDALVPRELAVAVEDDEVALVNTSHTVYVIGSLFKALLYQRVEAILLAFDFQFQHDALHFLTCKSDGQ